PQFLPTLAAITACVLGGAAIVATRVAVAESEPLAVAVLRYAGAGVVMFAIALLLRRGRRVKTQELGPVLALGALQFGLFGWLFTASLQYVPAARAALVLATMPMLTLALSALMGREKLTGPKVLGALFAFGGVAFALGDRAQSAGDQVWRGDALMFGAALIGSVYNVVTGMYARHLHAVTMCAIQLPAGAAALFVALLLSGDIAALGAFDARGWAAIAFLATVGGAASFYTWIWALERIAPSRVAVTITLNPIAAALLGAVILNEPITTRLLLGLVGVVAGIALANWPARTAAIKPAE
ncbi:MAG TPA: DMT family transporter, partial [Alphaproteobacteria bacterium]|nr:DMT family transporter [Alphaproteobacteria bacterium]